MFSKKTVNRLVLTALIIFLLPTVVMVWADPSPYLTEFISSELANPAFQGEFPTARRTPSFDDMTVQFGPDDDDVSNLSDDSGIEVVPGAAFIHTNELGNGTEAQDWFFSFSEGYITNDSLSSSGTSKLICLVAPVYIPPQRRITHFVGYVRDTSATLDITLFLDRTDSFGGWTELAAVQSVGNNTAVQTLTDPSITTAGGANITDIEYNYHVSMCLPAGSDFNINVYGAAVKYSPDLAPPTLNTIHLPILIKPGPPVFSKVFITNKSGGSVNYTVLNTPQGNINCVIPNGATNTFCGKQFTPGSYNWQATLKCGKLGPKPKDFPPGDVFPTAFRCD
ncbi:MAG: hypothetical protein KDI79_31825 [Anaerolineae bacterium]|nr:hypothetical protein [Anaerolineae bacterium]